MPIALLLIGALLIIVAFNNTMGQLAKELEADIPGFFVWAIAIAAILGLGYVPGMKVPSRWLLALVVLVIILVNYQKILTGFTTFASTGSAATAAGAQSTPTNPASQFAATGTDPTAGQVSGTSGATSSTPAGSSTVTGLVGGLAGAASGAAAGAAAGAIGGATSAATGAIANYLNPSSYVGAVSGFGGGAFGLGGLSGSLF
jgi:predicted membrane protein